MTGTEHDPSSTSATPVSDALRQALDEAAKYRLIVEASSDWIWEMDLDGRHTFSNGRGQEILGYTAEEFCWLNAFDILHPDDRVEVSARLPGLIAKNEGWTNWVVRFRHKNGTYRHLESSAVPKHDADGNIVGYLGVDRDITERREAQETLRADEERVRMAMASAKQGLWDLDVRTGRAIVSPEYATMLGYDPDTFDETNEQWIDRLHPDDRESVASRYSAYVAGEHDEYAVEFRQQTASGDWKWILSSGRIVERDADGVPVRMIGTHTDIGALKETEAALRFEEQRLRNILDNMFIFVGLLTPEGILTLANRAPLAAAGLKEEDVLGRPFWETYWWSYAPAVQAQLRDALARAADGATVRYDVDVRVANERLMTIDATFTPLLDPAGNVVQLMGHAVDITARKQAEREQKAADEHVRELQNELAHVSRVNLLGEMATGIAHELQQPLAAITNNSYVASEYLRSFGTTDCPQLGEVLGEIREQALRAGDIVRRLRSLVRRTPLAPRRTSLNPLVHEALKVARIDLQSSNVALELELADGLPLVRVDGIQLQQVILNVVKNAREALGGRSPAERTITIASAVAANGVLLSIHDNGPGLPADAHGRIFDPFYTTKADGMGLGLSISRTIIEAHQGRMWVEEPGSGGVAMNLELPIG